MTLLFRAPSGSLYPSSISSPFLLSAPPGAHCGRSPPLSSPTSFLWNLSLIEEWDHLNPPQRSKRAPGEHKRDVSSGHTAWLWGRGAHTPHGATAAPPPKGPRRAKTPPATSGRWVGAQRSFLPVWCALWWANTTTKPIWDLSPSKVVGKHHNQSHMGYFTF